MFDPRVVHASTPGGLPNRSSGGSYPSSTRRHGLSDRQNVTGRVDITVVVRSAPWTDPASDAQWERVQQMSAGGTLLTTRKPSIDLDDRHASGFGLRLNHAECGADRGIRQGTGQAVVLDQAPEMEIFDTDGIEPLHQHRTEFMQAITPGVGNLFVQAAHSAGLFTTTVRALLLSGQSPLGTGQQGGPSKEMLGIGHGLPVREGRQATEAKIDADRLAGLDTSNGGLDLYDHGHVVAARRMARDRHRAGIGRHQPTEAQLQQTELSERQPLRCTIKAKRIPLVGRAVSRPAFLLERRVGTAPGKEIHKCGLEVS